MGRPPKKQQQQQEVKEPVKKGNKKDPNIEYLEMLKKTDALGNIRKKIDFIPSGSWVVNRLIGDGTLTNSPGGFPRGYTIEIFGNEGCGKTTLALHAVKECQKAGGRVIYADFEHSLRTQFKYIENMGIDINPPMFYHLTPKSLEQGTELIGASLIGTKPPPALIVVDSVTAMLPKDFAEADANEIMAIGKHARLVGQFMNWITKRLERYNTCLILINQLRTNIKKSKYDPGPDQITTGGNAVKFFSNIRVEMKSKQKEKVTFTSDITGLSEEKFVNQLVQVTVIKNKLDVPFKSGPIFITFGQGINNILSLIELGVGRKVINRQEKGGWYEWVDPNEKYSFKIQGKQSLVEHLEKNPEVLESIKPYLVPKQNIDDLKAMRNDLLLKGEENLTDDEKETLLDLNKQIGDTDTGSLQNLTEEEQADLEELQSMMVSDSEKSTEDSENG